MPDDDDTESRGQEISDEDADAAVGGLLSPPVDGLSSPTAKAVW